MANALSPGNPYVAGRPLRNPHDVFFGREDIFRAVDEFLASPNQNAMVLHGQRRIGKTSVLLHLQPRLAMQQLAPVYLDLIDQARWPMGHLLYEWATQIVDQLHINMNAGTETDYDDEGHYFRRQFLSVLRTPLAGRRVVLLFDEFDAFDIPIHDALPATAAARHIFVYLRQLMDADHIPLRFIFAIGRHPSELNHDVQVVFRTAAFQRVSMIDARSARELITTAQRQGTLQFTESAIARILALTAAHPYFTQLFCQCLWNEVYADQPQEIPTIDESTIDRIIPRVLESGENVFVYLWNNLAPAERLICAAIADSAREWAAMTMQELTTTLQHHRVRIIVRELEDAPQALVKTEFLRCTDGGYSFGVELVRCWITHCKPLREVRNELGPMILVDKRLYELGESLYHQGEFDDARAQIEQALRRNPNYIQARLLLGQVCLAQGHCEEAVRVLDEAYQYDPDRALYSLIRARVTWGQELDRAEHYDQALQVYESVLDLSPSDQVAQERHRVLRHWTMLYEQALTAFNTADWDAAVTGFDKIVTEAPHFRDAQVRLEDGKRHQGALRERAKSLDTLYHRAVGVVHAWRLHEARDLLRQIQEIDPHFRDVRQMLNEVEEELKHDAERKSALFFKKIFWIILAFLPFIFFISFFLFKIFSAPSQTSFYSEYIKTISDEVKYKQKDILPINIKEKMNDDTRKSRIVFPDEVIKIAPVGEYIVENSSSYENILHKFVSMEVQGDKVIIDTVTHLMWQHSGSPDTMKWQQARDNFIMNLNKTSYAGYSDWRLPTIAELAMLLERTPKHGDLYIDQLFDIRQRWCWSVDRGRGYMAWRVKFHTGTAAELSIDGDSYVRAVRDHRTPE